jgi:hypothetical protein
VRPRPQAAIRHHPLAEGATLWVLLSLAYVAIFSAYWLFAAVSRSKRAGWESV